MEEEIETFEHAYVFCIRIKIAEDCTSKIVLDSWLDVSGWQVKQLKDFALGEKKEMSEINHALWGMDMRSRFNSDIKGIYQIKSHDEFTAEQIEEYINALPPPKRKEFLKRAKI